MIDYKTFSGDASVFTQRGRDQDKAELRELAKRFINQEVEPEHLINVTETETNGSFSMAVWYHARSH